MADDLAFISRQNAEEYLSISTQEKASASREKKKWCRPSGDQMKINSDGAFHPAAGDGGWGFVIRNAAGEVMRAGAGKIQKLLDAIHAEVAACCEGVRVAAECGMGHAQASASIG
ncbi:hypothetical protein C2845_PM09G15520 [Panicum miliaceum]|uniref:RNase H type-1 domain-containing protein n=1 Tax=Panicum miliaceum TaxID=4540 RepID=A0A3L6S334_PANMI|nr:hypothetical protein C2845_PM09G15520 [Panicum miliaceum]